MTPRAPGGKPDGVSGHNAWAPRVLRRHVRVVRHTRSRRVTATSSDQPARGGHRPRQKIGGGGKRRGSRIIRPSKERHERNCSTPSSYHGGVRGETQGDTGFDLLRDARRLVRHLDPSSSLRCPGASSASVTTYTVLHTEYREYIVVIPPVDGSDPHTDRTNLYDENSKYDCNCHLHVEIDAACRHRHVPSCLALSFELVRACVCNTASIFI